MQQDKPRTEAARQHKMYASLRYGPSLTFDEPQSTMYGENIDYVIQIVEHFISFLGGKQFLLCVTVRITVKN